MSFCYYVNSVAYRDRCEIFLDIFYQPWPKELICDKLPDSNDSNVCVGYKEAHYLLELGGNVYVDTFGHIFFNYCKNES